MNQLLHVSASPHIKDRVTTSSIMLDVIIALIPATLFGIIQFILNYICLFDYLFISSQMSAKPYFIGSTGILLLW